MRKAQLTMFVILGIVILSVFGFVFYTTSQVARLQAEAQAEKIVSEILETTALQFYIKLCAERALEQGIDILSKQGGKLSPSQRGSIKTEPEKIYLYKDELLNKTYNIAYGILREPILGPQYPCKPGYDNYNQPPAFCAYRVGRFTRIDFGIDNFPRLCKDQFSGCSLREGWNPAFSVQAQLESFVSSFIKECVDFESIIGVNQTYAVEEGNVSANITFSDTTITAIVNFPIIVAPIGSQPVIELVSFETTAPTKFKQLHGLARELVRNDVTVPRFDIVERFVNAILPNRYGTNLPDFVIAAIENASLYDNLIRLIDRSVEPGKELIFQFLIENRPPVLEYPDPFGPYDRDPPAGCGQYDILQIQDQFLEITPLAFDTEEDSLTFNYSGWLEDYNETIKNALLDTATGCVNPNYVRDIKPFANRAEESRWIKNENFEMNGIAKVFVTKEDIGYHNFTITVCDSQFCDFQNIRVLIDDLIEVIMEQTNRVGSKIFSIEDPYTFTATIKDVYNPTDYKFSWIVEDETGVITYQRTEGEKELKLPTEPYDINNIVAKHLLFFKTTDKNTLINDKFKVTAEVIQGGKYRVTNETIFSIKACIPYKSSSPPYPYNTTDPFISNHTCCALNTLGEPTIQGSGTTCFAETEYGSYNAFNLNKYNTPSNKKDFSALGGFTIVGTIIDKLDAKANDIIKRSFKRQCDGSRGNTCTGDLTEVFSIQSACSDLGQNEVARCSGPVPALLQGSPATKNVQACFPYVGTTFEKEVGITNSINCNVAPRCVSNNNTNDGFSNPGTNLRYYCNATCGGAAGCSRTTPQLCVDCYTQQSCNDAPTTATPEDPNTISFKQFSQCSDGPGCILTDDSKTDSCSGNILTDYACKTSFTNAQPYITSTIDCSTYNIPPATESDGGKVPSIQQGTCTQTKGSCSQSECSKSLETNFDGSAPQDAQGIFFYKEWYVLGSSCQFSLIDYDTTIYGIQTMKELCQQTFGITNWDDTKTGQALCCGDDPTETAC